MRRDVCTSIYDSSIWLSPPPLNRFLHASLQLQALRECSTRHDVEKALNDFPVRIADVYTRTWNRILNQPSSRSSLAINVLVWVVFSSQSLTHEELRHAISISHETFQLEPHRMAPLETLVSACCGLLVVEEETGIVRLVRKLFTSGIPSPY